MKKKEISEIVEMGAKAKLIFSAEDRTTPWDCRIDLTKHLIRFAKLVAAKEREACAKLLESRKTGANELMDAVRDMEAKAIRARGEQT